jgi:hypothetical protein
MKKLFLACFLMIGMSVYSHAQTPPATTKKTTTASTAKPAKTTAKTPTTATAGPTKKDGTADMRYKSNKEAAKAAPATTHTKKDGTPDKRYKENKK